MSRNALSTLPSLARRRPARPASVAWAWLLAAMVLAQSLGVLHNVIHAVPAHREGPDCALNTEVREHVTTGWVADLFAAHGDESDCRLYDQFSHGDCVPAMPLLCLPAQALPDFRKIFEASLPAIPAALVQARGPPLRPLNSF